MLQQVNWLVFTNHSPLIVHSVVTLFNAFGTWRVRVQIQAFLCSSTKSDTIPVAKLVDYMNDHQVRPYIEKMLQEYW